MARQVVDAALSGGHAVLRPWLGARTQALTDEMARSLGMASPQGVLVAQLWPGGPAARAGIATGDVIVSVDGQAVNDEGALNYRIATRSPGDALRLEVRTAKGAARTLTVRIEAPPTQPAADPRSIAGRNPLGGASIANLSPASAYQSGLDPFAAGVVVTKIDPGLAQSIGLQAGDVIRQINGRPIATTADVAAVLQTASRQWSLVVQRGDRLITARFSA
jgi:S1-C subfamily serine protease